MGRLFRLCVRTYQYTLGTVLPDACRFEPTCSEYAIQAVEIHGLGHGLLLALVRLLRCHPFGRWGSDPVPAKTDEVRVQDLECRARIHRKDPVNATHARSR